MKNKKKRLKAISDLLRSNVVDSQNHLLELLEQQGYETTQATLSRDLKQLKVFKTQLVNGTYKYNLPAANKAEQQKSGSNYLSKEVIQEISFPASLILIKTKPGYANAVAWDIDNESRPEVLGTIAGDDTILIATSKGASQEDVLKSLNFILPSEK